MLKLTLHEAIPSHNFMTWYSGTTLPLATYMYKNDRGGAVVTPSPIDQEIPNLRCNYLCYLMCHRR